MVLPIRPKNMKEGLILKKKNAKEMRLNQLKIPKETKSSN